MTPETIERELERLLLRVEKPARYTGGEVNQIRKPWQSVKLRAALAFPDIYDLGMPNVGLAVLYHQLNRRDDMLAERVYLPWTDMEALMRERHLPLFSLESKHAVADFDLLGISLPYETLYTNTLNLLDLAGIALRTTERARNAPIVIGGGHATYNAEPMAEFFDAFVVGEGEDVILEIAEAILAWKAGDAPRRVLHQKLATIEGVYVPSLYTVDYHDDGRVAAINATAGAPPVVRKRIVAQLPEPITHFIVPYLETVHNRVAIEIMRGCTRGCRFCQAGMITRPVRERRVEQIVESIAQALDATGFTEVGLLSLSSSDYNEVLALVKAVAARFADRQLNISLPSLRIESFSVELMDALIGNSRRSGFTLAPEAASERMREIINKPVSTDQLLSTAREVYRRGWHTIKLYFMIGHPQETIEDVQEICDLAQAVLAVGRQEVGHRAQVNVGVSTFVPKPHTPFQWVPCDSIEQIKDKQALLRRGLHKRRGVKLNWNDAQETMLESWLSRGDRRLGDVIERAFRKGARFDAWREHFKIELWREAFADVGLDPAFYTHRQRELDETLPWDHIDAAVTKKFLAEDYRWSLERKTRVDCRDQCFACGILPKFKELRRQNPGDHWECPDVGKAAIKAGLQPADRSPT
ncbi:MAG: TIGR03960 family B12-binding radical SAM protein [Deltaproteobacteria bacterium]|nr:TIGR03960 family B12-binding radical SAM protein [Deltaproteobacteria bacterium]